MNRKNMTLIIKKPSDCTKKELNEFEDLLIEAGEVEPKGAHERIQIADKLVLISKKECVAIGAIKKPGKAYRDKIFKKSGSSENKNIFNKELGWFYVKPPERGNGIGEKLIKACLEEIGKEACYATTRSNNEAMHYLLNKYSFEQTGKEYNSDRGDYQLKIYIKKS